MMKSTYSPASGYPRARGLASGLGGLGAGFRSSLAVLGMFVLAVLIGGCMHCGPNPGETPAEAGRRRERVLRVNFEQMMADMDNVLMLDEPSRLTDQDLP
jgi:hypothetical protein